jgi:hypothetical protein
MLVSAKRTATVVTVLALAIPVRTNAADGGVTLDAIVENSSGSTTKLSTLWKKPTVLFYEDRDSTSVNQHVKDTLYEFGRAKGMLEQVSVVAVANVAAFDWFPARNFVLAAVRDIEHKVHVPVYLDFKGALSTTPWNLSTRSSTVMVVDTAGRAVWKAQGKLGQDKVDEMFAELDRLVRATPGVPREGAFPKSERASP